MKKARILIDARSIDFLPHGVGRYAKELCSRLPLLKPEWKWLILRHKGDAHLMHNPAAEPLPLPENAKIIFSDANVFHYAETQEDYKGILKEYPADLIHSFWYPLPEFSSAIKVLTIHDVIFEMGFPEFETIENISIRAWQHRNAAFADHIISPSISSMKGICQHYNCQPETITVISEASSSCFHNTVIGDILSAKKRFSLPDRYLFCTAHSNNSYKNVGLLHEALRILEKQHIDTPHIVSTGLAGASSSGKWISLGYIPEIDLAAVLAGSEFMICPSKAEGFGLPLLEAMAAGTPVISSNAASLPEVGGDAVLYFDPSSPEELASAIALLLNSPSKRDELKEAGRKRERLFSWDRAAEETIDVYNKALSAKAVTLPVRGINWTMAQIKSLENGPEILYQAAILQRSLNNWLDAVEHCRALFELESITHKHSTLDFLRETGKELKMLNNLEPAIACFTAMLEAAVRMKLLDHQRSALYHMGECEFLRDKPAAAVMLLNKCLDICPDHQAALDLINRASRMMNEGANAA